MKQLFIRILSKIFFYIKLYIKNVITLIYPNKCVLCNTIIKTNNSLCSNCWKKIHFIHKPFCYKCSRPFKNFINEKDICIKCLKNKPSYIQARSAIVYDTNVSKILFKFKFYGKTFLKKFIAKTMLNVSQDILNNIDIFIPVPLHKKRLIYRKYNQSLLICNELAKYTNKIVLYDFLQKIKHTQPQTTLKYKKKKKNLKNKFVLNTKYLSNIDFYKQYNFAIIDDVITTESTINECIKVMNKYGIYNIYVITFLKSIF